MATRLKTVEFCFPTLASLTEASETNLTQITVYIPESSPSFKKVVAKWTANDIETAAGSTITEVRTLLQLGAVGYTTVTNTNDIVHSGEGLNILISADFTSHFSTNWTGTSMTCDVKVYADQTTPTTANFVDVCCRLEITYEYDDTSSTHIVTHRIPLDSVTGVAATSKPGSPVATIPALDTYCPEASKTFRDCWIEVEWMEGQGTSVTTDATASWEIDSAGSYTTSNHEKALASDRFWFYIWHCMSGGSPSFTTNATHSFYLWASAANHVVRPCLTLVVTYEFSPGSTTTVLNSVRLPVHFPIIQGDDDTTTFPLAKVSQDFYIAEPATVTEKNCAVRVYFAEGGTYSSNFKVSAGSALSTPTFTTYSGTAQSRANCGMDVVQHRVDSDIALARGKNVLRLGIAYDVSTTPSPHSSASGFWLLNYTSGKATAGVGAHNHTVVWNILNHDATANQSSTTTRNVTDSVPIPESGFFVCGIGAAVVAMLNTSSTPVRSVINVTPKRLSGEGLGCLEPVNTAVAYSPWENGATFYFLDQTNLFKRWAGDPGISSGAYVDRLDLESSRTWRSSFISGASTGWYFTVDLWLTYHAITFSKTTTVSSSGGGTVNLTLCRKGPPVEAVLTASRSGNGTVEWTWYDDTETMFVEAREDATHVGRSNDFTFAS